MCRPSCLRRRASPAAPGATRLQPRGEQHRPDEFLRMGGDALDQNTKPQTSISPEPAEGRPDLGLPGADRPDELPGRENDLPERLGERISGDDRGVATGEPDLKPD